jgi:hypothetical protein
MIINILNTDDFYRNFSDLQKVASYYGFKSTNPKILPPIPIF